MNDLEEIFKQMRKDVEAEEQIDPSQEIINDLINERNKEKKRADELQYDLDKVDELHFEEVQALHEEIVRLKLIIKH